MKSQKQHCNVCAWRATCQLKFTLLKERNGVHFCKEFTRDVSLPEPADSLPDPNRKNSGAAHPKRYFSPKSDKKNSAERADS